MASRAKAFPERSTNSDSTLPSAAHLDGGVIGCHQCITLHTGSVLGVISVSPYTREVYRVSSVYHLTHGKCIGCHQCITLHTGSVLGVISVSPYTREVLRHLPPCDQPSWSCPASLPTTTSIPAPTQPSITITNKPQARSVIDSSAFHSQFQRF